MSPRLPKYCTFVHGNGCGVEINPGHRESGSDVRSKSPFSVVLCNQYLSKVRQGAPSHCLVGRLLALHTCYFVYSLYELSGAKQEEHKNTPTQIYNVLAFHSSIIEQKAKKKERKTFP